MGKLPLPWPRWALVHLTLILRRMVRLIIHFYDSITTTLLTAVLAYKAGSRSKTKLYVLAALAVSGVIPFTALVMSSTNSALAALATGSTRAADSEIMELLNRWIRMNYVRSCLPLLGSVLGLLARNS